MALKDNATLVINTGNFFTAEPETDFPADLDNIPEAWENIGHTSLEEIFSQSSEGGEATILGTLQNKTLRTTRSTKTDTFNITVQQFDADTLKLFYGSNMIVDGDLLGVPQDPVPTTKAFLAVFVDQGRHFCLYVPKAEILGGDAPTFDDAENLAGLQLAITPVMVSGKDYTYAVTPIEESAA